MSVIEFNQVGLSANTTDILADISFSIEAGQHTTISGPSGSGKSTILKLMAFLINPTQGNILYENQPITEMKASEYRKEVSYSYQSPQLFGETVRDNLSFPAYIRASNFDEDRATDLLDEVGLDYITFDKSIESLSGGEKQRVSLIRNLMYPPKVLLLDEITAGLDEDNREKVWDWLFKKADQAGTTLVWISHNPQEQDVAKQHLFLKQGQIERVEQY